MDSPVQLFILNYDKNKRLQKIADNKHKRRAADRGVRGDRRRQPDRRAVRENPVGRYRYPSWPEQQIQYLTRFIFLIFGLGFYNFTEGIEPLLWERSAINLVFGSYFLIQLALFLHASHHTVRAWRFRAAMWVDIVMTSIAVLNDPYPIPPSLLVYIMVVLGNGMRYGMRLFAESLIGSFGAAMLVLSVRYLVDAAEITPGLMFLNLFGGTILVYSYVLMGRIEHSRCELERSSSLDTLTGLLNRRALMEVAGDMFQRLGRPGQRGFVLLFADLDRFKQVNDELGHPAGDLVLREFAHIVQRSIRDEDTAGRFGGDEFIILLEGVSVRQAKEVVARIQRQVERWARDNDIDFSVTFGLGEAPTHGQSFQQLLEQVDQALYHSKSTHTGGGVTVAGRLH
ncbi:MAG TPA: GGDEF domain-containing protein [Gammaproteobacteria bacterium]|nr:GGDEF domain-containing protein [Gammaproteobacteria bacterium]